MSETEEMVLVARDQSGSVRAWVSFDKVPWKVSDLVEILQGWAEADPGRVVSVESSVPTLPPPPNAGGE